MTEALERFDRALETAMPPCQALHDLAQDEVGVTIFSVTLIDQSAGLARRIHTSHPKEYPVSGTKPLIDNGFLRAILSGRSYRAATPDRMVDDFPDLDTIRALGCGSVLNLPVRLAGEVRATVNLLHVEGHFDAPRCDAAEALLHLPCKAAVALALAFPPA